MHKDSTPVSQQYFRAILFFAGHALNVDIMSSNNSCSNAVQFVRLHFYKLMLAIVLAFLIMQYIINVLVHHRTASGENPTRFGWISSFRQILGLSEKMSPNETIDENIAQILGLSSKTVFINSTTSNGTKVLPPCPLVPPKLVGPLRVMTEAPSFEELETMFSNLKPGGRYWPEDCTALHKVAIIIPYRDRAKHLRIFLHNIHPILQRQLVDYGIYIIEEARKTKFNRAMLMNIGFVEALKQYNYQCFIFHDVDLIPEDDRNLYTCPQQPRHMSVAVDTMDYKLPYRDIFGGVSALSKEHMELVNGFSNEYWGWGGEDDDMSNRIRYRGLQITRYSSKIARYKMLKHKKDEPNPDRYNKLYRGKYRYKTDGLSNLKYKRLEIILKKLYTWVLVEITPPK
ncbi:beta-1,4-N-acetylgalactosaminyltransferase bre-4-like [Centruroides vittatus]|uniref:beta-1,4-N-acetylgalactosaminyltransferase bre-4-like n=1 Tax=Centruroides vittatus TaxID=120091 RepID=UPI003510A798